MTRRETEAWLCCCELWVGYCAELPFLRVVLAACNLDGWGNVFSETKGELAYCLAIAIPNSNEFLKLAIHQL